MRRLDCCQPITYDAGSTTMVHNFGCSMFPEGTKLTGAEMAKWRDHPAGKNVTGATRTDRQPNPVRSPAPVTPYRGRPVYHTGPYHCPDCAGIED